VSGAARRGAGARFGVAFVLLIFVRDRATACRPLPRPWVGGCRADRACIAASCARARGRKSRHAPGNSPKNTQP
jgi:hypothetical protein